MAKTLGHDISKWQGDVNFDTYKKSGKSQFVIIKSSEGVGYTDTKFKRNQSEIRRVGILLGYYHFARPDLGNSAVAEADYFLKVIGKLNPNELIALDYECANQVQAHVDWCRQWLDHVYAKTGVRGFIYLNRSQVKKFNWTKVIEGNYALWIAAYTHNSDNNEYALGQHWKSAAMQQYTNKASVAGINGGVDGNVFFGSLTQLKKYGYKNDTPTPEPTPEPEPTPVDPDVEKLFKKKLSDKNWKILKEFQKLADLKLILRDDSIQSQLIKWIDNWTAEDEVKAQMAVDLGKARDDLRKANKTAADCATAYEKLEKTLEDEKLNSFVEGRDTERDRIALELGIRKAGEDKIPGDFDFKAWKESLTTTTETPFEKFISYLKNLWNKS